MPTSTTLDFARWLVHDRGLSVIPIDHPETTHESDPSRVGKVPAISWKSFQYSPPGDDDLQGWFGDARCPRNLAIVTGTVSRVVAVDGDSPEALTWMAAHLPITSMRTQTAKGEHWFFRYAGEPLVRNRVGLNTGVARLALDVRGEGGYVISPPSQHVSGAHYTQIGTWPPIADLPLLDANLLPHSDSTQPIPSDHTPCSTESDQDRAHVLRRARAYMAQVPPAIEGKGGDQQTFKVACTLVRGFDLSDAEVRDVLHDWNARCVPPWTARDLDDKLAGA